MRRSNLATFLYLAVVFVSGAVVGGFAVRLYLANTVNAVTSTTPRNHAEARQKYIQEMRSRLHLNESQIADLQRICDATGQKLHEQRKSIDDEHVRQVNALLDDTQKAEYAKIREERERRRQQQNK